MFKATVDPNQGTKIFILFQLSTIDPFSNFLYSWISFIHVRYSSKLETQVWQKHSRSRLATWRFLTRSESTPWYLSMMTVAQALTAWQRDPHAVEVWQGSSPFKPREAVQLSRLARFWSKLLYQCALHHRWNKFSFMDNTFSCLTLSVQFLWNKSRESLLIRK